VSTEAALAAKGLPPVPVETALLPPWWFTRKQLLERTIRLRRLIQHPQEFFVALGIQRKQSLIQEDVDGVLASTLQNKVASGFADHSGSAID